MPGETTPMGDKLFLVKICTRGARLFAYIPDSGLYSKYPLTEETTPFYLTSAEKVLTNLYKINCISPEFGCFYYEYISYAETLTLSRHVRYMVLENYFELLFPSHDQLFNSQPVSPIV
jgi:hypothetical protein